MLFSNELNYWVIKKNAKKDLLLRMGRHIRTCPQRNQSAALYESFDKLKLYGLT
ncbi:histidine kinase [Leptospira borgpetersenii serovar Tarassovi]|nr:histidine kinase [Leptospira borgpetersenii serovar Tarassovi]